MVELCHLQHWHHDGGYTIFPDNPFHGCTVIFTMRKLSVVPKQNLSFDNLNLFHFVKFSKDMESMSPS